MASASRTSTVSQGSCGVQAPPQLHVPTMLATPSMNELPPLIPENYPLKDVSYPHPHDVLCGRGGQSNTHAGNNQWRMLVASNKELYVTLPKKQKMLLSQSIVNAVRSQNPPGRFLQKSVQNDLWCDVGDKRAQEKTSQALREGAPELRVKLYEQKTIEDSSEETTPSSGPLLPSTTTSTCETNTAVPTATTLPVANVEVSIASQAPPPLAAADGTAGAVLVPPVPVRRHTSKEQMPPPAVVNMNMAPSTQAAATVHDFNQPNPQHHHLSSLPHTHQMQHDEYTTEQRYLPPQFHVRDDHESMPPPPTMLDPLGDCSFGSMGLMTDAEQSRLENVFSFGQPTAAATTGNVNNMAQSTENDGGRFTGAPPEAIGSNVYSYHHSSHQAHDEQYSSSQHVYDDLLPLPVDGGLEPIGLSFGSMMSMGTAAPGNSKLEGAGLSFGSAMSYSVAGGGGDMYGSMTKPPVHPSMTLARHGGQVADSFHFPSIVAAPPDNGLHDIGTSFGSLTLADGERERIIADAERDMALAAAAIPSLGNGSNPTFLKQQKSKGSLLDCSDTESEDEETSAGISAQKSAEWDKLQAVMAERIQSFDTAHVTYGVPPSQRFSSSRGMAGVHEPSLKSGATFNLPTVGLDRDFSQMSAISVGDDFDPIPTSFQQPSGTLPSIYHESSATGDFKYHSNMPVSVPVGVKEATNAPMEQSSQRTIPAFPGTHGDAWKDDGQDLEEMFLNRGNSLASEAFSEPPEPENACDH